MPHKSYLGQELGQSLEILEGMLEGNPVLERIYRSLDKEESEPVPNCHGSLVYQCIDRFVETELDLSSMETLGLGRKNDQFPRLASHLRETLEGFSSENMLALKMLLFDLTKSGYDFMVLMECSSGRGIKAPVITVLEQLFLAWITSLENFKFESLGPAAAIFRDQFAIGRLKLLADELKPFDLFEQFARDARLQHIFRMYIVAGLALRVAEAYY